MSIWDEFDGVRDSLGRPDSTASIPLQHLIPRSRPPTIIRDSSMPARRIGQSRFTHALVAGGFVLASGPVSIVPMSAASAGECGCQSVGAMPEMSTATCDCCTKPSRFKMQDTLFYKALDTVAGGIEKVFRLDQCHSGSDSCHSGSDSMCDDACDSAMMGELMIPMPPMDRTVTPMPIHGHSQHGHSQHGHPQHGHSQHGRQPAPQIVQPTAPSMPPSMSPRQVPSSNMSAPAPQSQMRMTQPQMSPMESGRMSGRTPGTTQRATPAPEPMRDPDTSGQPILPAPPIPDDEDGSLFDSLSNPFGDDEVHVHRFNPIQPSNYEPELRPIRKRAISTSQRTSSRRTSIDR